MVTLVSDGIHVRIISYNVRYATTTPFPGEELWSVRCPKLCAQLRFITSGHQSPFICLQEVLHSQIQDIQSQLGTSWTYIGQGRDDGKTAGEFSPIFFRTDSWECKRQTTYWLSETPERPSRGWDAALNRVVTVGCFQHRVQKARVMVMSTHLDHMGVTARRESAKVLLRLASAWSDDENKNGFSTPVFLGGDFNSSPGGGAYREITRPGTGMKDISELVPKERRYGNDNITYTSFGGEEGPSRIDFVFVRDASLVQLFGYSILANRFDDGIRLSDHRPVVADVMVTPRA
jgi:endonuclease/exonuclease/phosphatase family metal-dependent hydrolase